MTVNYETIEQAIQAGHAPSTVPALCLPLLAAIADRTAPVRAVRHPLGFFCLPVQRRGPLGVCIHVWTAALPRAACTMSPVHSHSWDLASFVLYGSVGNRFMRVADDPQSGSYRVFEVRSHGEVDEMRATRRLVRCVEQDRQVAGAGTTYYLAAGSFHESVLVGGAEAATVVLGRSVPAHDLSLGRPDVASHRVVRQWCDERESADAARVVTQNLVSTLPRATRKTG
jgi:hypothetical protein